MYNEQEGIAQFFYMEDIAAQETRWLWYPYIPYGKVTIIQGDPGEGKSTLVLNLIAALTKGVQFPTTQAEFAPRTAIYQNAEDGLADTVKPRLVAAGADCRLVAVLDDREYPLSMTDTRLDLLLKETGASLLVLDPLQAYLGEEVDMHRANEIRPVMHALSELAAKHGCAIILVGHMNKASSMKSIYRGLGSIDITAAARSVLTVARDPSHPENRVILQVKNSLAPMGEPVAFTLDEGGRFRYLGAYEINPAALLNAEPAPQPKVHDKAEQLILEWLDKEDPLYARDIYDIAESEDISRTTLLRAKKKLGIQTTKTSEGWVWFQETKKPRNHV